MSESIFENFEKLSEGSNHVVLMSGGVDSYLVAYDLAANGVDFTAVHVNYGNKYNVCERMCVEKTCNSLGVECVYMDGINLAVNETPEGIVPYRNAYLILAAASVGNLIYLGILNGEINSDKSTRFLELMTKTLNECTRQQYWTNGWWHSLLAPLRGLTKTQAVSRYLSNGGSADELVNLTVSCYNPSYDEDGIIHCGKCPSCFKRWVAFTNCRIGTDQRYANDPKLIGPPVRMDGYDDYRKAEIHAALNA